MSEYGNEEVQDNNGEIEEEQELDDNISNNKEINLEDFEPINEQDIELEGESFEPSYSIETDIHDYQFEIPNNITFKNTYEEFEPIHDEKNVLACRPPNLNTSWIQAIINDPTLTTSEKIEKLEKKKRKLWNNSELSIIERDRISKAIDHAKDKLIGAKGGIFDSSIPSNRDAAGKHDTSNFKDSQNSIDNEINNQEKFQSEQSEKQDLAGANNEEKELELKEKKERDSNGLSNDFMPENEPEYINNFSNDRFEPHDENKSIYDISEVDFIPKDEKNYEYLLNDDLCKNFKEYFNETGRYANWGTKIRKDFINKIDNKINNKSIKETKKELLKQIKQICNDINNKQEIKNFIMDKIENHNLSYKEILKKTEKLGLSISLATISRISERELGKNDHKIKQNKWSFLDFDKEGKLLSYNEQIQKAAEFLKNNILNNTFKKKYRLEKGIAPPIGLKNKVLTAFRGALYYRNLSYNDILEKAGFKTNYDIGKWSFLDRDSKGNPLNYDKAIEKAAEYLTQEILTDEFNTKYGLGKGEAPPMDIENEKFRKFISAISNRDLPYNDILEKAGFKTNLDIGKWSFLDRDSKGNPLDYDKAIEKAAEYLTQEILTNEFKEKFEFGKDEAPTIAMDNKELKKFRGAIGIRGLSYNNILEKAGLIPNLEKGKWSFLDRDSKGNPLNYDKAIEKAAEYLTQEILTSEFKEKYELGKDEAPTMNTNDKDLKQFFSAVAKRNLSYNDILENAGYEPHESTMFNRVGNNMHVIQEKLFLQHTREKGCITFYEPYTNIYTKNGNDNGLYIKFGLKHGDNCGIIEDNFKNLSNEMKRLCDEQKDIKMIIVDYYLGNSKKVAKIHCLRGYQGKEKMLILMPTHAIKQQSPPTGIPYRKNVKILDPLSFSNLMGYKGEIKEKFMKTLKLAKEATWKNNGSKETLERLANECKRIIKEKYDYGYKDLEEFVKNQKSNVSKDILGYDPDKSNIDYYL